MRHRQGTRQVLHRVPPTGADRGVAAQQHRQKVHDLGDVLRVDNLPPALYYAVCFREAALNWRTAPNPAAAAVPVALDGL